VIAVVGAGAMGTALALLHHRAGMPTTILGTKFDDATVDALRSGRPHPALGISVPAEIESRAHGRWGAVLQNTERVVVAVSSDGLPDVVADVARLVRPDSVWLVATKGWDQHTLRTPSEVVSALAPAAERIVVLGGPVLAPELVAAAPTAMVVASRDIGVAREVARSLEPGGVAAPATDDVAGVEIGAAYKNVTAIAVGMSEGLSERLPESVYVHRFGNARAALFAHGLRDMIALAAPKDGRVETILGLAGAGDLYVTCLGGRNGNFGRLLGEGQTPDQARNTIGSTVEGIPNTAAALAIGGQLGLELVAARAVDDVLSGRAAPDEAVAAAIAAHAAPA
jgi:glycerol-3-phosphate dehydrogenase (NAD(P)+)